MLRTLRDTVGQRLLASVRRMATTEGWGRMRDGMGAPNLHAGLLRLRDLGFQPSAVIDGGACVGHWSLEFQRFFAKAQVLMVEPQARHADALSRLCASHPGLHFSSALLGPPGLAQVEFVEVEDAMGTGSSVFNELSDMPRHKVSLQVTTLDELLAQKSFPQPDLIKLDVQGYELEVLKGADQALRGVEFVLLEVSVWQYNEGSPLVHEVLAWMASKGFWTYDLFSLARRADGVLLQLDILFVRKDSRHLANRVSHIAASQLR